MPLDEKHESERRFKQRALLLIPKRWRARIFNNPVGAAWVGREYQHATLGHIMIPHRRIKYGLADGSADLIGICQVRITPEMVGRTVGVFTALECKTRRGRATAEQASFLSMVRAYGGIAALVRTVADIEAALAEVSDAAVSARDVVGP